METYQFELEANLIQLVVLILMTIWLLFKFRGKRTMPTVLFFCGLLGLIAMNVYWNAMLFVDGAGSYAFVASDASMIGAYLMWTSMFRARWNSDIRKKEAWNYYTVSAMVFVIWCFSWWVLYSGFSLSNITSVLTFGILLYSIFYAIYKTSAMDATLKYIASIVFIVLAIFEILVYLLNGFAAYISDIICSIAWLMFGVSFAIAAFRKKENRTYLLFVAMLIAKLAQFLTAGIYYSIFMMVETIFILILVIFFDPKEFMEVEAK